MVTECTNAVGQDCSGTSQCTSPLSRNTHSAKPLHTLHSRSRPPWGGAVGGVGLDGSTVGVVDSVVDVGVGVMFISELLLVEDIVELKGVIELFEVGGGPVSIKAYSCLEK